ncbi:sugar kinase [Oceanobacillus caeni]|uniref:sugar kinase n=1 Tax=Oceanobacillus caeni TaxID=405946 RepID=UPI000621A118|nr:sugar kinase [Oceanobacillus caeni]KKE77777.1 2-dehydro-3-deoxygluconokinase [Bacilli bacterium VT-13-104]PZD87312.1 sugar kinase [Bacilli bacterium]MCR1835450.1 sugar kinase [Oceanobacillus caeni]PZD88786.1 sugar kinase [Bacilli bacterium]PZD91640.1 sugar kinase [Bacilli bacterium]
MPKKIIAFGEVMMRLQVPGYELLTQANTLQYSFSGTGVNVASAMTKLGHDGYLVTKLPDNPLGDAAISFLNRLGIGRNFISRGGKYVGMYFLENGFGQRSSRVTYTNRLESTFNTADISDYDLDSIAENADVIHFCGISLAMTDNVRESMKILAQKVKEKGGIVCFDCNYRPSLWDGGYAEAKPHYEDMLSLADIVMMNEKDAMYILGMETEKGSREEQLQDLIPKVAEKYNIQTIAGTHRGVNKDNSHSLLGYMYKDRTFVFSENITFSVYDRIGAGDAYTSGILHGELSGFPPEKTVQFAASAGMLACTIVGDTPMSTEAEILSAMSGTIEDIKR